MPPVTLGPGSVLAPLQIVAVIPANFDATSAADLAALADALASDGWYGEVGVDYALGSAAGSAAVAGPSIAIPTGGGLTWTKADAQDYITSVITANAPAIDHTGHTLYLLFVPYGLNVDSSFGDSTISPSYHSAWAASYAALGDAWAPIQPNKKTFSIDQYSGAAAHETIEAATDTSNAWALRNDAAVEQDLQSTWLIADDNLHAEVGDLCQGSQVREPDGFEFVRVFSNRVAALGGDPCIPSLPREVYNNTTPVLAAGADPTDPSTSWKTVPPPTGTNTAVDFQIAGWTGDGSCQTWAISAATTGPKASVNDFGLVNATVSAATISTGQTVVLHVEVPAGTPSGQWGAVHVHSTAITAPDKTHDWIYGVYVK
jgi:hypothetical protein